MQAQWHEDRPHRLITYTLRRNTENIMIDLIFNSNPQPKKSEMRSYVSLTIYGQFVQARNQRFFNPRCFLIFNPRCLVDLVIILAYCIAPILLAVKLLLLPTSLVSRCRNYQRWSPRGRPWPQGRPRGHILKSLALASRLQVLENWPVLGSRTALFFELLKFFWKTFFCGDRLKNFCEDLFFWRALALVSLIGLGLEHSCPWPRECLSSERLSLVLASDFFCVLGLGLEPCVLDSTSSNYRMDPAIIGGLSIVLI